MAARLSAYHAQTAPLIDHYAGQGLLSRIDAMAPIDEVAAAMAAVVETALA